MSETDPQRFFKTSRIDLVLIVSVVVVALGVGVWIAKGSLRQPGVTLKAYIYHDSRLIKALDLRQDGSFDILEGKMRVQVKARGIRITYSDCLRHICTHTGWIQNVGQTIVCVPNHVMIEIKPADLGPAGSAAD